MALRGSVRVVSNDPPAGRSAAATPGPPPAPPAPSGDTTPPTAPGNVRSTGSTQTTVSIAWNAATDNLRVAGYGVYQNNAFRGTVAGTATTFPGLTCGTTYTFGVDAFDPSGNRSARASLTASTSVCTSPPPPPPPPPSGGGTTLTFTDTYWRCTRPVSEYATIGLPLRVVMLYTRPFVPPNGGGAVQLGAGCVGDGSSATDLILDIRGDGRTYGPGDDAIRIMNEHPGASNLEIEGRADCGPRVGAAHQDGVQVLGGTNITFRSFEIGDYAGGRATCQGAGGAFFYSGTSTNVDVEGGQFIACNHALLAGWPSPARTFAAPASAPAATPSASEETFAASEPCDIRQEWRNAGGTTTGLTCQRWNGSAWVAG